MKRSSLWVGRRAAGGTAFGAAVGVLVCFLVDSKGLLPTGVVLAGALLSGYSIGVATAYSRREIADISYILRLREELRLSQDHIMENATFLSLGAYLDAAAEEIKPPLLEAAAAAQKLAAEPGLPEGARQTAAGLSGQLDTLSAVLRHLAAYQLSRPARAPFSVNTILRETIQLCRHRAQERSIIFDERYAVVPPVFGPAVRVHQALHSILVNSVEAMPHGGGTIVVETAHEGDRVTARVHDAGTGIRPEHLSRIFDPFFTTKPEKNGVGLGLWAARRTFDLIGADIAVKSAWLQGTEVVVNFPQAAPVRAGREGEAHPPEMSTNTADARDRRIA